MALILKYFDIIVPCNFKNPEAEVKAMTPLHGGTTSGFNSVTDPHHSVLSPNFNNENNGLIYAVVKRDFH